MIGAGYSNAGDPRSKLASDELRAAQVRSGPWVASRTGAADRLTTLGAVLGVALIGAFTLVSLAHHRQARPVKVAEAAPPPPAPAPIAPAAPVRIASPAPMSDQTEAEQAPAMVVDNTQAAARTATIAAPPPAAGPGSPFKPAPVYFGQDEQFAARADEETAPTSHVSHLSDPAAVIAQGTIIPAVLETALNSDLPGYARALVSQDVRSFDGKHVLIPRESRLIGEYKSALQTGQSRAFIIWTRVLRPDGVSVQLGSPATDQLGEAGLSGRVDRHFLQRYGAAILLSVVGGAANAIGGGNTVVIGASTEATSAASVALQNQLKIPPTVRVPQGTPIQVFVARDLDFSAP
jgi:type IV secretion system protein VirB10